MFYITVKEYKNDDDSKFPPGTINYPARYGTTTYLYKTKELYISSLKEFAISALHDNDFADDQLDPIRDLFVDFHQNFDIKENLTEEQIIRLAEFCYQEMDEGFFDGSPIKFGECFCQEENVKN
jgi:hypothetical protein